MTFDKNGEEQKSFLTLAQAAALLPNRPAVSTLHRWRQRGVRGVKLQTCLIGGRRYTTTEWLEAFIAATSEASSSSATPCLPHARQEAIERAIQECDEAGI